MLASSRKPGGGRKLRKWRKQRLSLARQRNQSKRRDIRRSFHEEPECDGGRVTEEEYMAAKKAEAPEPAGRGRRIGVFGMLAALAGVVTKPLRKKVSRGR